MSECILWTGGRWANGRYGYVWLGGKKVISAHRKAWIDAYGEIPNKLFVCHKCDVPLCVNPKHLFLGTHKDNMQDALKKGRLKGFESAYSTEEQRTRYINIQEDKRKGMSFRQIREKYNIKSDGWIGKILKKDLGA